MRNLLQILIAIIFGLGIYIPTARAQANLTFSGGNNTPLSITLQTPVRYATTSNCDYAFPIFQNAGNPFSSGYPTVSGTITYTTNGGPVKSYSRANSGIATGDIGANDIYLAYQSNLGTLPATTDYVLNAGTVTTATNVAGVPPPNGSYVTFLICADNSGVVGGRISANGTAIVTAAAVSISGRVLTDSGRSLQNAVVSLTQASGVTRTARTGPFGYYRFDQIEAGQTVVISVISKRFQFTPQVVTLADELTELDFTPSP